MSAILSKALEPPKPPKVPPSNLAPTPPPPAPKLENAPPAPKVEPAAPQQVAAPAPKPVAPKGAELRFAPKKVAPANWTSRDDYKYSGDFSVGGADYNVSAQRRTFEGEGSWQFRFERILPGGEKTEKISPTESPKVALQVFERVGESLREFIEEQHPNKFIFTADSREPSRVRLYDRMAQRIAQESGYFLEKVPGDFVTYRFIKTQKSLEVETKNYGEHKHGCLMACLPLSLRKQITDWALENIPENYLGSGGYEFTPHVTILFGFKTDEREKLKEILSRFGSFSIRLADKLSLFQVGYGKWDESDGDVLKIDVESLQLRTLNSLLKQEFDTDDKFPEFKPHITIAYLRPEVAEACVKYPAPFLGCEVYIDEVEWSGADGDREYIPLSFLRGIPKDNHELEEKAMSAYAEGSGGALVPPPQFMNGRKKKRTFIDLYRSKALPEQPENTPTPPKPPQATPIGGQPPKPPSVQPTPIQAPVPGGLTQPTPPAPPQATEIPSSQVQAPKVEAPKHTFKQHTGNIPYWEQHFAGKKPEDDIPSLIKIGGGTIEGAIKLAESLGKANHPAAAYYNKVIFHLQMMQKKQQKEAPKVEAAQKPPQQSPKEQLQKIAVDEKIDLILQSNGGDLPGSITQVANVLADLANEGQKSPFWESVYKKLKEKQGKVEAPKVEPAKESKLKLSEEGIKQAKFNAEDLIKTYGVEGALQEIENVLASFAPGSSSPYYEKIKSNILEAQAAQGEAPTPPKVEKEEEKIPFKEIDPNLEEKTKKVYKEAQDFVQGTFNKLMVGETISAADIKKFAYSLQNGVHSVAVKFIYNKLVPSGDPAVLKAKKLQIQALVKFAEQSGKKKKAPQDDPAVAASSILSQWDGNVQGALDDVKQTLSGMNSLSENWNYWQDVKSELEKLGGDAEEEEGEFSFVVPEEKPKLSELAQKWSDYYSGDLEKAVEQAKKQAGSTSGSNKIALEGVVSELQALAKQQPKKEGLYTYKKTKKGWDVFNPDGIPIGEYGPDEEEDAKQEVKELNENIPQEPPGIEEAPPILGQNAQIALDIANGDTDKAIATLEKDMKNGPSGDYQKLTQNIIDELTAYEKQQVLKEGEGEKKQAKDVDQIAPDALKDTPEDIKAAAKEAINLQDGNVEKALEKTSGLIASLAKDSEMVAYLEKVKAELEKMLPENKGKAQFEIKFNSPGATKLQEALSNAIYQDWAYDDAIQELQADLAKLLDDDEEGYKEFIGYHLGNAFSVIGPITASKEIADLYFEPKTPWHGIGTPAKASTGFSAGVLPKSTPKEMADKLIEMGKKDKLSTDPYKTAMKVIQGQLGAAHTPEVEKFWNDVTYELALTSGKKQTGALGTQKPVPPKVQPSQLVGKKPKNENIDKVVANYLTNYDNPAAALDAASATLSSVHLPDSIALLTAVVAELEKKQAPKEEKFKGQVPLNYDPDPKKHAEEWIKKKGGKEKAWEFLTDPDDFNLKTGLEYAPELTDYWKQVAYNLADKKEVDEFFAKIEKAPKGQKPIPEHYAKETKDAIASIQNANSAEDVHNAIKGIDGWTNDYVNVLDYFGVHNNPDNFKVDDANEIFAKIQEGKAASTDTDVAKKVQDLYTTQGSWEKANKFAWDEYYQADESSEEEEFWRKVQIAIQEKIDEEMVEGQGKVIGNEVQKSVDSINAAADANEILTILYDLTTGFDEYNEVLETFGIDPNKNASSLTDAQEIFKKLKGTYQLSSEAQKKVGELENKQSWETIASEMGKLDQNGDQDIYKEILEHYGLTWDSSKTSSDDGEDIWKKIQEAKTKEKKGTHKYTSEDINKVAADIIGTWPTIDAAIEEAEESLALASEAYQPYWQAVVNKIKEGKQKKTFPKIADFAKQMADFGDLSGAKTVHEDVVKFVNDNTLDDDEFQALLAHYGVPYSGDVNKAPDEIEQVAAVIKAQGWLKKFGNIATAKSNALAHTTSDPKEPWLQEFWKKVLAEIEKIENKQKVPEAQQAGLYTPEQQVAVNEIIQNIDDLNAIEWGLKKYHSDFQNKYLDLLDKIGVPKDLATYAEDAKAVQEAMKKTLGPPVPGPQQLAEQQTALDAINDNIDDLAIIEDVLEKYYNSSPAGAYDKLLKIFGVPPSPGISHEEDAKAVQKKLRAGTTPPPVPAAPKPTPTAKEIQADSEYAKELVNAPLDGKDPVEVEEALKDIPAKDFNDIEPTWKKKTGGDVHGYSYGGVIFNNKGEILLVEPKNHYQGYVWTFPKGGAAEIAKGEHPVDIALAEVLEESGQLGQIVGMVPESFVEWTQNFYFLMHSKGENLQAMIDNNETESMKWVSPEEAKKLLVMSTEPKAVAGNLKILDSALKQYKKLSKGDKPVVGFDFDGVLHSSVEEDKNVPGLYHVAGGDYQGWEKWEPNQAAIDALKEYAKDHKVVIVTARDEKDKPALWKFLEKVGLKDYVDELITTGNQPKLPILEGLGAQLFYDDSPKVEKELATWGGKFVKVDPKAKGAWKLEKLEKLKKEAPPTPKTPVEILANDYPDQVSIYESSTTPGLMKLIVKVPQHSPAGQDLNALGAYWNSATGKDYFQDIKLEQADQVAQILAKHDYLPFPQDLGSLVTIKTLGGASGAKAKLVKDAKGHQWVVKKESPLQKGHLEEEVLADKIYNLAGIASPSSKMVDGQKVAKYIEGESLKDHLAKSTAAEAKKIYNKIRKGFVLDALLGNYDVIGTGFDNILVDKNGDVWRIDNGSALSWTGTGKKKPSYSTGYGQQIPWDEDVSEIETLRDPHKFPQAAKVFKGLTDDEITEQIGIISQHKDEILAALPASLRPLMEKRLKNLQSRFGPGGTGFAKGSIYSGLGKDWKSVPPDPDNSYVPPTQEVLTNPIFKPYGKDEERKDISSSKYAESFKKHMEGVVSNLSGPQTTSVKDYTNSGYSALNEAMRNCPETLDCLDSTQEKKAQRIEEAIAAAGKFESPVNVWRNSGLYVGAEAGKNFLLVLEHALATGKDVRIPAIKSTSLRPDCSYGGGDIKLEIRARSGLWVEGDSQLSGHGHSEAEVLQGHNVRYRVRGIYDVKDFGDGTKWGIYAKKIVVLEEV